MDYDSTDIPGVYDRGRNHGPENLQLWMNVIASSVGKNSLKTILDLGCGTGRFTESLASHFDAEVFGIDPSKKMLKQAQLKLRDQRVRYLLGRGEAIPLSTDSIELVFSSMTFHHFDDPMRVASECRRVVHDGGTTILRTGTSDRIPSYPYLPFFPESRPIMEDCLPTSTFICEVFETAGFSNINCQIVVQEIAPDYAAYTEKLAAGADSVLAQLSESDFQRGLDAMRTHANHADSTPVCEPIDVFVFR